MRRVIQPTNLCFHIRGFVRFYLHHIRRKIQLTKCIFHTGDIGGVGERLPFGFQDSRFQTPIDINQVICYRNLPFVQRWEPCVGFWWDANMMFFKYIFHLPMQVLMSAEHSSAKCWTWENDNLWVRSMTNLSSFFCWTKDNGRKH